jgi:hypothetical protein
VRINTYVCNGVYIGERGLHMTPAVFARTRYSQTVLYPSRVSQFEPIDEASYQNLLTAQRRWAGRPRDNEEEGAARTVPVATVSTGAVIEPPFGTNGPELLIRALYRLLLLREPDQAGLEGHVKLIQSGQHFEHVMRSFLRSKEFDIKHVRFLEKYVVSRASPLASDLQPVMTHRERDLLASFLRCSLRYLEFGSGGSTVLASACVRESVTSVDSSEVCQNSVARSCVLAGTRLVPLLIHVDIGPIGDWGNPIDATTRLRWPEYVSAVWRLPHACMSDLCLIDGRFRVASFVNVLLHCPPTTIIMMHDFPERKSYHVIREFANEIASTDSLAVFLRRDDFNAERAAALLKEVMFQPA